MVMFEIKTKWIKSFRRFRVECFLANCTILMVNKLSSVTFVCFQHGIALGGLDLDAKTVPSVT